MGKLRLRGGQVGRVTGSMEAASFWVWFVPAVLRRQTDGQQPLLES